MFCTKYFFALLLVVLAAAPPLPLWAEPAIALAPAELERVEQGEIIVREVAVAQGSGRTFEAVGLVAAPLAQVEQVLTDYQSYPHFMPNVSAVEILEQERDGALLNYILTLPLDKIKKYRLRLTRSAPAAHCAMIQWHLEQWPGLSPEETIKDTTGYWLLQEKSPTQVLVLYHVFTDPGPIPLGLGWIVDILSEKSVPEALTQTKIRAEDLHRKKTTLSGN